MFNSYSIRIDVEATGRKIRELRMQKSLRIAELAEIMHSSENTIYKWQRGECMPTIDNLVVLSELFETPLDEIIQREGRGDEPLLPVSALKKDMNKRIPFIFMYEANNVTSSNSITHRFIESPSPPGHNQSTETQKHKRVYIWKA